ncbi:MAG: CRTAC1 family protein [Planctomycetales bacterium]|nr:CRTAC1 family protein [Planctomycetales bacterium]
MALPVICVPALAAEPTIMFRDVTEQAGLVEPLAGIMGHGGAWGDFDRDGRLDLFVGGFCDRPNEEYLPAKGPVPTRLFRNQADGTFTRVDQPGVEFFGRVSGAVFADLNNDGWPELYSANNSKGRSRHTIEPQRSAQMRLSNLFRNDHGRLIDVSQSSGAVPGDLLTARNIGVFDYDQDGLLDLLVVEDLFIKEPGCRLLRNTGGLRFEDVTKAAGLPTDMYGLGLAVADLNGDRRPDFFVGHSNRFFLSRGDATYYEPASLAELFSWKPLNKEDWPCGAHFGDINRDGLLDMVLSIHHERARNRVYLNRGLVDGVPKFEDVTSSVGLPESVPNKSPHVELQDFDNDGWLDLYLSTAWLGDDGQVTPLVFRNTGLGKDGLPRFQPPREIGDSMVYYPAGPSADYDRDGRLDLFLINWFAGNHCRLMRNESPERNWLDVQIVGQTFNRMGIGSQIRVTRSGASDSPDALLGFTEINIGYGYASGQEAIAHFGLGDHNTVDLSVRLPNGTTIERHNVAANQRLVIEEEK